MDYRFIALATDQSATPAESTHLAEEYGLESSRLPEHTHLPLAGGRRPEDNQSSTARAGVVDQRLALGMHS